MCAGRSEYDLSAPKSGSRPRPMGVVACIGVYSTSAETACTKCREEDSKDRKTSEPQSLMRISYAVFCLKTTTPHSPTNLSIVKAHQDTSSVQLTSILHRASFSHDTPT